MRALPQHTGRYKYNYKWELKLNKSMQNRLHNHSVFWVASLRSAFVNARPLLLFVFRSKENPRFGSVCFVLLVCKRFVAAAAS